MLAFASGRGFSIPPSLPPQQFRSVILLLTGGRPPKTFYESFFFSEIFLSSNCREHLSTSSHFSSGCWSFGIGNKRGLYPGKKELVRLRSDQIRSCLLSPTHPSAPSFFCGWPESSLSRMRRIQFIHQSVRERESMTQTEIGREKERGIWVTSFFLDQRRFMKKQSDLFSQCGFCLSVLLLVDLVFFPSLPFFISSWCFLGVCMQLTPMQLVSLQICDLLLFVLFDWHSVVGFHLCGGRFGAFFTSLLVSSSAA